MRWLKHISSASEDDKISALLDEFGPEGYGVWWLILEAIALGMDPDSDRCSIAYSEAKWCQKLRISARKLRSIVPRMQHLRLISVRSTDNRLEIEVAKLLKYKDEYSRKAGHSPDSVRSKKQIKKEIQNSIEGETETPDPADAGGVSETDSPPADSTDPANASGPAAAAAAPAPVPDDEQAAPVARLNGAYVNGASPPPVVVAVAVRVTWFTECWRDYWRKDSPEAARRAFLSRVKTVADFVRVKSALSEQSPSMLARAPAHRPYLKKWLEDGGMFSEPSPPQQGDQSTDKDRARRKETVVFGKVMRKLS